MNILRGNLVGEVVQLPKALDQETCNKIIELSEQHLTFSNGEVGIRRETNAEIRNDKIAWIPYQADESSSIELVEKFSFVYDHITNIIKHINQNHFQYELTHYTAVQISKYMDNNGKYEEHTDTDTMGAEVRKLSLSVQLSDPNTYDGGDLKLYPHSTKNPFIAAKEQGLVVGFPSYNIHEVTPVTSGVRYSLVVWVYGPPFK